MSGPAALYVHVPFCHARCRYCDFHSHARSAAALRTLGPAFVESLIARIEALGRARALTDLRTAYIGGGTPSVLGVRLADIVRTIRSYADIEELTCEANPESFTDDLAAAIAKAGATRVSLGVQSFDDGELRAIGRLHDADAARAAIRIARRHGLRTSIDLMCGLPGQTDRSWDRTLAEAVRSAAGHVSVYPLVIEDGTPLAGMVDAGLLDVPDEDFQADAMARARDVLGSAGLEPYEVASYAATDEQCLHNIAYWTGVPYLGIGPSAASMLDRASADAVRAAVDIPSLEEGSYRIRFVEDECGDVSPWRDIEHLSGREAAAEDLMLGMRLTDGLDSRRLRSLGAMVGEARLARAQVRAERAGLARWVTGSAGERRFAPTERGWLLGNELFGIFWELASDD